jgi:hypothetical protein
VARIQNKKPQYLYDPKKRAIASEAASNASPTKSNGGGGGASVTKKGGSPLSKRGRGGKVMAATASALNKKEGNGTSVGTSSTRQVNSKTDSNVNSNAVGNGGEISMGGKGKDGKGKPGNQDDGDADDGERTVGTPRRVTRLSLAQSARKSKAAATGVSNGNKRDRSASESSGVKSKRQRAKLPRV